jgi:hypothetical protein
MVTFAKEFPRPEALLSIRLPVYIVGVRGKWNANADNHPGFLCVCEVRANKLKKLGLEKTGEEQRLCPLSDL